jgi:hypothetical protein
MFLPVGADIKFKMIPDFNKDSIADLTALFGCVVICGKSIKFWNRFSLSGVLILIFMFSPFVTNELNSDPIVITKTLVLPGLGIYDAGSAVIAQFITLIPFFLGRHILRDKTDTQETLRVLVIAGLLYSVFALFEIRFSPQLHTWIYGYFPHMFAQQVRDGGFRPVVFMGHGLLVAFFFCTTAVAAAAFWRTNTRVLPRLRLPAGVITAYLSTVLLLCKTAGSTLYGAILVPLVYFAKPKTQLRFAVALVSAVLLYPMLRMADLVPTQPAIDLARSISSDRAASLEDRFVTEDKLLENASQRFSFGWGRFGRGFIYDTGGTEYSADGLWVDTLVAFGFFGFLAQFGLLSLPVFAAASALRFAESAKDQVFLSALALTLAINIFDLLPNSPLRPWTWLVAGALLGRAEALRQWASLAKNLGTVQSVAQAEARNPLRAIRSK